MYVLDFFFTDTSKLSTKSFRFCYKDKCHIDIKNIFVCFLNKLFYIN